MVTLRIYDQPMLQQRTDFLCYGCGHWSAYFLKKSPDKCDACNKELPNLQGMLDDRKERRKYHFSK